MKKKTAIIIAIVSAVAAIMGAFLFIHRNVIKALIKGEELPELPEGHLACCVLKKSEEHPACCETKKSKRHAECCETKKLKRHPDCCATKKTERHPECCETKEQD